MSEKVDGIDQEISDSILICRLQEENDYKTQLLSECSKDIKKLESALESMQEEISLLKKINERMESDLVRYDQRYE